MLPSLAALPLLSKQADVDVYADKPTRIGPVPGRWKELFDAFSGMVGLLVRRRIHALLQIPFVLSDGDEEKVQGFERAFSAYDPYVFDFQSLPESTRRRSLILSYTQYMRSAAMTMCSEYHEEKACEALYDLHVYFVRFVWNWAPSGSPPGTRSLSNEKCLNVWKYMLELTTVVRDWVPKQLAGGVNFTTTENPIVQLDDSPTGYALLTAYWTARARINWNYSKLAYLWVAFYREVLEKAYGPGGRGFIRARDEFLEAVEKEEEARKKRARR